MALDLGVLLLVLLSAALHASWNALVKAGNDRLVMTTLVMVAPAPVCVVALFFLPALQAGAWPFLIASALIHYLYYALLIGAYKHGDLSQVYPISRGAAPALVALAAWAVAGEALSTRQTLGVLIVSAGIMSLAWRRNGTKIPAESRAIVLALTNGAVISAYLITDGLGVRQAGNAFTYISWLFVLEALPLLALTLWRRRGRLVESFAPNWKPGVLGGTIAAVSYGIALWAMSLGPMAHIVALRETSVLFGAALGALVLKESFGPPRVAAAAVVALGAVLLNLGA
jgi:drug/metabolite transporter (DMT)-like permease